MKRRDPSEQTIQACITALLSAERQGLREKVLAVIRMYQDSAPLENVRRKLGERP